MTTSPNISDCQMFCRGCGYALIGLPSNRCPECGREFDPANPRTFLARPRRVVLRRIIKIVLVLFCLSLPLDGYVGYLAWQVHQEAQAIEFLQANDAIVTTYDTTPAWVPVILRGHTAWLWKRVQRVLRVHGAKSQELSAAVANFKSVQEVEFDGRFVRRGIPAFTDSDVAQLRRLTSLQKITLSQTWVTDAGLENLEKLTALQYLSFDDTHITDADMIHVCNSELTMTRLVRPKGLPGWRELYLYPTQVSDVGLEHLKGLRGLKTLDLGSTQVTDAGLERLKGMTGLQTLHLGWTPVTDAGLKQLKGMTGLQTLDLSGTQVTDAGLEYLKGLSSLQRLILWDTRVTDAGLVSLKGLTRLQQAEKGTFKIFIFLVAGHAG